jgi:Flp pilus assembly protein TadG
LLEYHNKVHFWDLIAPHLKPDRKFLLLVNHLNSRDTDMMIGNLPALIPSLFRRLGSDRRGVTAVAFAVGATALFGLIGLATEGGTWYVEKRHGQNAADAAATAGALALSSGSGGSAAVTSATNLATSNGYTSGTSGGTKTTVTINYGTYSGGTFTPNTGSPNAVKAVITRSPQKLFSGLFLGSNPSITELAVAMMDANNNACVLAKTNGLSMAGSTQINLSSCSMASNETGPNSISFTGNKATVSGGTLVSSGGCSNCGNSPGYLLYQPPTTDPYLPIQSVTMPPKAASKTACQNMPSLSGSVQLSSSYTYEGGAKMFCTGKYNGTTFTGDLHLTSGTTLNLSPGTYIFFDASIQIDGGATLTCSTCTPGGSGVTIILTGDTTGSKSNIGTLSINGSATVTLNAPATNTFNSAFNGVLFYMDKNAPITNGNGNAPVSLNGDGNVQLTGGMYFPSVNVNYSGNVASANSAAACTELVGASVQFTGNSTLNINGCTADGTKVAQTESVHLVQ